MPGRQLPLPELHEAAQLASDLAERTKGQGFAGPVVKASSGQRGATEGSLVPAHGLQQMGHGPTPRGTVGVSLG